MFGWRLFSFFRFVAVGIIFSQQQGMIENEGLCRLLDMQKQRPSVSNMQGLVRGSSGLGKSMYLTLKNERGVSGFQNVLAVALTMHRPSTFVHVNMEKEARAECSFFL